MQPIATDTSDFGKIRQQGCVYVDKTAYFHQLITQVGNSMFFLARPRRFGKSLMISTFKAIFEGRRDLFQGLGIEKTNYDWARHPVIRMNFGFAARPTAAEFQRSLLKEIERALQECGAPFNPEDDPGANFGNALDFFAKQGKQTVVLIDEYDDPAARTLDTPEEAEAIRKELASVYGQMKDRSEKIRFLMITGVSKFTKMSVFSALSNLVDISFNDDYAAMLGFTEDELDAYFGERLRAHERTMGMDDETYRQELRRMYNGYRFWLEAGENVYNPVSISLTLAFPKRWFEGHWSATGKASFLMHFLKREEYLAIDITRDITATMESLDVSTLNKLRPVAMLFQTGYLTIKSFTAGVFALCVPNEEVRRDLSLLTAGAIADKDWDWAVDIGVALLGRQWDEFFRGLEALYAGLTYGSTEKHVHESSFTRNLCFLLWGQGFRVQSEAQQATGRADLIADHPCGTYIFELKVNQPAAIAMAQAVAREYAAPYRAAGKPVWLIGLSFDGATRKLTGHEWAEVTD